MKLFFTPLFLLSLIEAKGIDDESLGGIYVEAIFFVGVILLMSAISIIISKRDAKKFEIENPLEDRRATRREEELQKELSEKPTFSSNDKVDRLLELSTMLKDGIINKKEFETLKNNLNIA